MGETTTNPAGDDAASLQPICARPAAYIATAITQVNASDIWLGLSVLPPTGSNGSRTASNAAGDGQRQARPGVPGLLCSPSNPAERMQKGNQVYALEMSTRAARLRKVPVRGVQEAGGAAARGTEAMTAEGVVKGIH